MSIRFIFEVQYQPNQGEDVALSMATLAQELFCFDGVTSVRGHGPMATIVTHPAYDVFAVDEDGIRLEQGQ